MTNSEMVKVLRERTARAIINYCVNKFGQSAYIHNGRSLLLSMNGLTDYLIEDIEVNIKEEITDKQQALLFCIDAYSEMLAPESTGKDIDINTVQLSDFGIKACESAFSETIEELEAKGVFK